MTKVAIIVIKQMYAHLITDMVISIILTDPIV